MNKVSVLFGTAEAKSHGYLSLQLYYYVNQDLNCWANKRKPMAVIMNMAAGIEDRIYGCLSENKRIHKAFQSTAHGEINLYANVVFTSNHCHRVTTQLQLIHYYYYYYYYY